MDSNSYNIRFELDRLHALILVMSFISVLTGLIQIIGYQTNQVHNVSH